MKNVYVFNDKELEIISRINEAKMHVSGEIELSKENGNWYARDYKEDLDGSFIINNSKYIEPLITEEEIKDYDIDVEKCCNYCDSYQVG